MKISESGRSMVEMLGVLAVIGVLSIGGIAGYMIAMNRHHSNNVLEGVSARAVIISAQKMMGQPAAQPADMAEEIDDYAVAVVEEPGVCAECFGIEVSGIPQGVCRYILNQKWTTPAGVYLNDDEYPTEDGTNCNEADNVIEFVFSPSMGGESNTCGYCQHDENGNCVADVTCNNDCPGDKPVKNSSGTCYSCSARGGLTVDATECAKCSNRYLTSAGKCVLCNTSGSAAADASECAKCPNRSMQDGLCVRDRCPDGQWMSSSGNCFDCSWNSAPSASETECAKCSNRYLTSDGKCAPRCTDGQWMSSSGACYDCDYSSSATADASECAKCSNRFRDSDGYCRTCGYLSTWVKADATECAKCSDRYLTTGGYCHPCDYPYWSWTSATECAKCPNREIDTYGHCSIPCSDGQFMYVRGNYGGCISCSASYGETANATECAKCSNREMKDGQCVLK